MSTEVDFIYHRIPQPMEESVNLPPLLDNECQIKDTTDSVPPSSAVHKNSDFQADKK